MFPLGILTWDRQQLTSELAYVTPTARRLGIATRLFELARKIEPDLRLSGNRTADGDAWTRSLGLPVPPRTGNGIGTTGLLLGALHGLGPDALLSPAN